METFSVRLHICTCGYKTIHSGNASRHRLSCDQNLTVSSVDMVLKTDHLEALSKASGITNNLNTDSGINFTHNGDNVNINLVLPEKTTKEDFLEYLETLNGAGFRSAQQIIDMPGKLLTLVRDPNKFPGAITAKNNKIIEKLPDGSERVMGKKKAVQTYTNEAVDALYKRFPHPSVPDYLEKERGMKRSKMSVLDASKLRVENPHDFHNRTPADVKNIQFKMEKNTEKCLDKITAQNTL